MRKKLFVDGRWIEGTQYYVIHSPYSREVLAHIPAASEEEVEQAIQAAERAKATMAALPAFKRANILETVVQLLEGRKEEAAKIIALEAGKPISLARAEIARTIETYKFSAEEAKRIYGETIPLDASAGGVGRIAYTRYEPLGVIAAITPFNFPMNLVAHKLGPAFAAGNTVVLKPASQTPLSAFFIAELFAEAGLPDGALNVITGSGGLIGDRLVRDPRVKLITFTGSPAVGKEIRNKAGLKRVVLELGSNSAVIIDRNVPPEKIMKRCVTGAFSYQGQVCISLQRIYVHQDIYDEFVASFVEETKRLTLGDPLSEETEISAMISEKETERALAWIKEAIERGATIATGGKETGKILEPTVLLDVPSDVKVSCQEVFAPVVIINKVQSIEEAIDLVNQSDYGLQAGIYTEQIETALHVAERLQVGGVMINDIPTFRVDHMPYGGVKESGLGREGIKYAIKEMLEMKLVVWNRN